MKKLVLYSDQVPPLSDLIDIELVKLFDTPDPKIGYISSASDPERKYFTARQAFYARLGLDLNLYFELDTAWRPDLLESLLACDAIHLSGGNTYYFLYWLRARNMMDALRQYTARGGILIGVSADSILMTPDISTSALCGDTEPEGETDVSGLGLVDFSFVPHHGDSTVSRDDLEKYATQTQTRVYAAKADGGIIVLDDEVRCIGNVIEVYER